MLQWWKRVLREYFTFSSTEKKGSLFLLGLIVLALLFPVVAKRVIPEKKIDYSKFKQEIDSFEAQLSDKDSLSNMPSLNELDQDSKSTLLAGSGEAALFNFDPNTASKEDFQRLGISNRVANTILNYRQKGGKFFTKKDFQKIYGLKQNDYDRLEPYIQISTVRSQTENITKPSSNQKKPATGYAELVDLNAADSLQLVMLPGIGPVLSSRILKYRNRLGGFYSVEQLTEVYGMKPETIESIKPKITVNEAGIKKININSVSVDELRQHPYFKAVAIPVVNYRDQHGIYHSSDDLKNVDVITPELLLKIAPYLEF